MAHGGIKPENFIFQDHCFPALINFGLPSYSEGVQISLAPEFLKRKVKHEETKKGDIYALGVLLS